MQPHCSTARNTSWSLDLRGLRCSFAAVILWGALPLLAQGVADSAVPLEQGIPSQNADGADGAGAGVADSGTSLERGRAGDPASTGEGVGPYGVDERELRENLANREQGSFVRKSVAYLDALWQMDGSVQRLGDGSRRALLGGFRKLLGSSRFDRNPLPPVLQERFVEQANVALRGARYGQGGTGSRDAVAVLGLVVERELVPAVSDAVAAEAEMRAQQLVTEQQRNSFMAQKAKEFGVTAVELNQVMNAAYVFIPLARNYSRLDSREGVTARIEVGVIAYRILREGSTVRAVPVLQQFAASTGFGSVGMMGRGGAGRAAESAMLENAVRNMERTIKSLPDFRLSAQVRDRRGSTIWAAVGSREGVQVDDKFTIAVMEEHEGELVQKDRGWARVTQVGDSASAPYQSRMAVQSGSPLSGDVMVEYPRVPIDIHLAYGNLPTFLTAGGNDIASGLFALHLEFPYNVGRSAGISQLFAGIGGYWGGTQRDGSPAAIDGSGILAYGGHLDLVKKFWWRRFGLELRGGAGYDGMQWSYDSTGVGDYTQYTIGSLALRGGVGGEIALTPAFALRGGIVQLVGAPTTDGLFRFQADGLSWWAGLVWSPPSLPFDPVNFLLN